MNQIKKNSKKNDVSEITCFNSWVIGNNSKDCKDSKQSKPVNKDEKKGSRKDSKIKTNSTAVEAIAALKSTCESRSIAINDSAAWSACADERVSTVQMMVKARSSLDSVFTIHQRPHHESLNTYEAVLIGQRHVTVVNEYKILVLGIGTVHFQMRITNQGNKVLMKNVVLNSVLHAPESK